ncbi:hypothetical protein F2Q70_00040231 [Brassica cretica]|uniref:Protein kinase domain-containing protein n=1 Tax=Brassica cretica TaxID=69181 RepID=A0A8S9K5R6_BRACR|nr:hypothetical protein F2Q70_00040231 [Brassica cretica]
MIWGVRLRIAVDISGALSYLHSAACSPVYHRDVKSTNILLDEKYRAKVSDFVGYVDPEYYVSSQYTDKSDVYSFGVILVELITGEKPVIALPDSQEIRGLADHFRAAMKENKFFDIMDARIRDACKPEQVMAVANLARRCLNSKGKKRPYMTEVFTELERILSSPEDSLVRIENDDGDDAGEEGRNTIGITDSWTAGVTAPAFSTVTSPSSADVQPLFPRATCLGALGLNLESTGPGVFDALFSSFSMILVTEGLSIDHSLRARETTKTSAFVAGFEY